LRPGRDASIQGTSIASIIFVDELTFRSEQIVGQNFKFFVVFASRGHHLPRHTSAVSNAISTWIDATKAGAPIGSLG
jgi:ABC-type amino acid transport system permease subunit